MTLSTLDMTIAHYFLFIFDRVMTLDKSQNYVSVQSLWNGSIEIDQILTRCIFRWLLITFCLLSTELWPLIDIWILFVLSVVWNNW